MHDCLSRSVSGGEERISGIVGKCGNSSFLVGGFLFFSGSPLVDETGRAHVQ